MILKKGTSRNGAIMPGVSSVATLFLSSLLICYTTDIYAAGDRYLDIARNLLANGNQKQAKAFCEEALQADPNNGQVLIGVAILYSSMGMHREAINLLTKAAAISPDYKNQVTLLLASEFVLTRQSVKAYDLLDKYIQKNPLDPVAVKQFDKVAIALAREEVADNANDRAIPYYLAVLNHNPNDTDVLIETARVYGWLGKHQEAVNLLQRVVDVNTSRRNDVLRPLGWQYIGLKKPEIARSYFKEYLANFPRDTDALNGMHAVDQLTVDIRNAALLEKAREFVNKKQYSQALTLYTQVLNTDPNNTDILIEMARVQGWAGLHLEAVDNLQKVIEIVPARREDVLRPLGWQLAQSGSSDKAIPYFKAYLAIHPGDDNALSGLAYAQHPEEHQVKDDLLMAREWVDKNNYEKALVYYYRELKTTPNNTDLLIEIARVEGWLNHPHQAIHLLRQVLRVEPQRRQDVLRPLGWQFTKAGDPGLAIAYFQEYLLLHPSDVNALLGLADAYEQLNELNFALQSYDTILTHHVDDTDALFGKARVLISMERYHDAINTYEQILALKPSNKEALTGIARAHNYRGRNRLAASEYQSLVTSYPNDSDLKQALAYAQYWSGFEELALATLQTVHTSEAEQLKLKLERSLGHPYQVDYDGFNDTDGLNLDAITLKAAYRIDRNSALLGVSYRVASIVETGESFTGNQLMIGYANRLGSIDSRWGTHWINIGMGDRKYDHWNTFAWKVEDKWVPTDLWKIYLSAYNNVIENVPSIPNHITYGLASVGVDYNFITPATLSLLGSYSRFSDTNQRSSMTGRFEYRILNTPSIILGADGTYFDDTKPELYFGYYNPASYREGRGYFKLSTPFKEWNVGVKGLLGRYKELPGGVGSLFLAEAYLDRDFLIYGSLRFYIGKSHSYPLSESITGYGSEYYGLSYMNSF